MIFLFNFSKRINIRNSHVFHELEKGNESNPQEFRKIYKDYELKLLDIPEKIINMNFLINIKILLFLVH